VEIGLGCVSCQPGQIDSVETIVGRVETALKHVAPERITLNPDCGFAPGSAAEVSLDEVYTKLKNEVAAARRLRDKSAYSSLPCYLLPSRFTLAELQATYEQVMGEKLDKSSFRRKLSELDFLEVVRGEARSGAHRPAQLYRMRKAKSLAVFDKTM